MTYTQTEQQQAVQSIVTMSHRCYQRGWSPATSSNYSQRLDSNAIAITCSGLDKSTLDSSGVMLVDLDGKPLSDGKPSAETLLHTQLYKRFPSCGAVLHTHSPQACVISRHLSEQDVLELQGYEIAKAFEGISSHDVKLHIPLFENTQNISELAQRVDAWCEEHVDMRAYIIRGHGLYIWATQMDICWRHLEAFEYMLHCQLLEIRMQS
jgi:methylthioribulose-1-phosphate dehydratase